MDLLPDGHIRDTDCGLSPVIYITITGLEMDAMTEMELLEQTRLDDEGETDSQMPRVGHGVEECLMSGTSSCLF